MAAKFAFDNPQDALIALSKRLGTVSVESDVDAVNCTGRVLAQDVLADRDSPAADVSAMDGYAMQLSDLSTDQQISISAEAAPGSPPPSMTAQTVVRIFTGAIVPTECDAVVKREDTEELGDAIRFCESAMQTKAGDHIRRAGENAPTGSTVLSAGTLVTAAQQATMANFGCQAVNVYSRVRVSIITTGDEVGRFTDEAPAPWQLRNSNRDSLSALLTSQSWVDVHHVDHCIDDRDSMTKLIGQRLAESDAILVTGGVSMGDYDYVPDVIKDVGGQIAFHGLPIRPGKPILGAATESGKLILGLPGNPVSATIGCRRFGLNLLAKQSGRVKWNPPCPVIRLDQAGTKTIPLHWMRLVRLCEDGLATPVISQGSGDLVSLGQSTGFVEVSPGQSDESAWPYYAW